MPDIIDLVKRWWKQMLAIVMLSLLVAGVITFLKPRQYLAVATAVPASSFSADKSKIFSENIEALYLALSTPDDLDMILGTATLDTVYLAVTDQFNLYDHYKMAEEGDPARRKAAFLLKKDTKVMKSEYGQLKVKVWDTDKNLAPQLANAIMDKLNAMHQDLQGQGNKSVLNSLMMARQKTKSYVDSINLKWLRADSMLPDTSYLNVSKKQIQQYEKLIGEYQVMVDSKPPVLISVEKAKPSDSPDKPRRMQIMIVTAVLSFFFALFAALILERRKLVKP